MSTLLFEIHGMAKIGSVLEHVCLPHALIICISSLLFMICMIITIWYEPANDGDIANTNASNLTCSADMSSFIVAHFTDLHYGEDTGHDVRSKQIMEDILSAEGRVDLAVFGGDQVSGWMVTDNRLALQKWAESLSVAFQRKIKFATIFGNHDDQPYAGDPPGMLPWARYILVCSCILLWVAVYRKGLPRFSKLMCVSTIAGCWITCVVYPSTVMRQSFHSHERELYGGYSQTRKGAPGLHGSSNYYLPITCNQSTFLLFFLDSGGGRIQQAYTQRQLDWVLDVSLEFPGSLSMLFVHVPALEYDQTFRDRGRHFKCWGSRLEDASSHAESEPDYVMHHFHAAGVKAVFVGHDHENSWCCVPKSHFWSQPALCYGRHTGQGGYGTQSRGARIIQVGFKQGGIYIDTWVRLENKTKIEHGVLYQS